jgi:hypothetical protein
MLFDTSRTDRSALPRPSPRPSHDPDPTENLNQKERAAMRRALVALLVTVAMTGLDLGAAGCGGSHDGSDDKTKIINVTFSGDSVTPNGERVKVGVDQPIEFVVKADKSGEMHVHSTPEQELEYAAGTTTIPLKIDKPGIITVESHALNKTIVQLEVQ